MDLRLVFGNNRVLKKYLHEPCFHATRLYCKEIQTLNASYVNKVCPFIVYATKHFPEKQQRMGTCVNFSIYSIYTVRTRCPSHLPSSSNNLALLGQVAELIFAINICKGLPDICEENLSSGNAGKRIKTPVSI
jgi:hypothetical protein